MTEHESNLLDLYAGLAMMGWIMNGDYSEETIPYMAHDIAQHMLQVRKDRADAKTQTSESSETKTRENV